MIPSRPAASQSLVLAVRGSPAFIERCRTALGGRARLEAVTVQMVPKAVAEWRPAVVVVPEELHGEKAERLRAQGAEVLEIGNDALEEDFAARLAEALNDA